MRVLRLDRQTRMEVEDSGGCRLIAQRGLHYFDRDTNQFEDYVHCVNRDASVNGFALRMKCEHWSRFGPGGKFRFGLATGKFLTCTPQGAVAVAPVADGPVVTYNGVWTNTDLSYCVFPEGVKETIKLNAPDAPTEFAFGLCCNDVVLRARVDGGFNVVSDGVAIGIIQPATAVDAAGATVSVAQTIGQGALTMTIDPVWLADPARQWPVMIDPTITLQPNGTGIDTYTDQGSPDSNYGTATMLRVGRSATSLRHYILLGLPAALVAFVTSHNYTSATMSLYVYDPKNIAPDVYALSSSWGELTVTYNNQPGVTGTAVAGPSLSPAGWKNYDIKTIIGSWIDGIYANNGLTIKYTGSGDDTEAQLYSSDYVTDPLLRPKFTVVFEYFPGAPIYPIGTVTAPTVYNAVSGFTVTGGLRHYITRDTVPAIASKQLRIRDAGGALVWDAGVVADVQAFGTLYGVSYQASGYFYGQSYMGQNFVAIQPHINGARVALATELASVPADDITVELYAADGDGKPVGAVLAQGVIIRFASAGALVWKYVQLTPAGPCPGCLPTALTVGAKYVIIIKAPAALIGNRYKYGYGADSYSYNILSDNQADAEAGLGGFVWSAGTETLEWTTAKAWHGIYSIKVVTPGNVVTEGVMTNFVSAPAGVVRSGSLYAIGAGTIKVVLQAYSAVAFLGESVPHVIVLNSITWTRAKTENFLTPVGTTRIRLIAVTSGTAQAITFYIDGLQVELAVAASTWKMPISGVYSTDGGVTWTVYQDRDYQIEAGALAAVTAVVPPGYLQYGKVYKVTAAGVDANATPFVESTLGGYFICIRTTPAGPTDLAADDHLFVVGDDGKVWTIDEGTTDDGAVIAAEWISGALTARQFVAESMARQLKLKRLWVVADVPTGATLGVRVSTRARDLGDGADWSSPSTIVGTASPQRVKIPLPIDAGTLARTPWFRIKFSTLGPVQVIGIYPDVRLKK